jgi:hypothetical protein
VKHKTQIMNNLPLLNDLRVFMLVARRGGPVQQHHIQGLLQQRNPLADERR